MHVWPLMGNLIKRMPYKRHIGYTEEIKNGLGTDDLEDLSFCNYNNDIVVTL